MGNKLVVITSEYQKRIKEFCKIWPEDILYLSMQEDEKKILAICEENPALLVAFEKEEDRKRLAALLKDLPDMQQRVISLAPYTGNSYFENTIYTDHGLEESVLKLLELICVPGVVNLDYYDLHMMVSGKECTMVCIQGTSEEVLEKTKTVLTESGAKQCLVYLSGEVEMSYSMELEEEVKTFDLFLYGMTYVERPQRDLQLLIIYHE